jgi:hypothetical protein
MQACQENTVQAWEEIKKMLACEINIKIPTYQVFQKVPACQVEKIKPMWSHKNQVVEKMPVSL